MSWPGLVVKDPKESKLLTYPVAGPQHTYKKLDSDLYKDTLYPAVQAWLAEEGKNIVTTGAAEDAGKHIPPSPRSSASTRCTSTLSGATTPAWR